MIAVVVKCGKNDYMVIDDREWSSFNNIIKSLSGSDKKNRTYKIGDRNFTYKETKKFKHLFTGTYASAYNLMPEIITEHGNYKKLIDDILESLKIAPGKRWDYVLFFANDFNKSVFKDTDYDYNFEAVKKHDFLMFFEDENIEKLRTGEYEALLKIALYARYDTEDDILNRILGDARFELPADFDIYYSDESEMDEKLKFIRNKSIIEDFFINNRRGLQRFLARENEYSTEIISVLNQINPVIYTTDRPVSKMRFTDLFPKRITDKIGIMGFLDARSATNNIIIRISQTADKLCKLDFESAYKIQSEIAKVSEEFCEIAETAIDGIVNVPELFNNNSSKKILESIGNVTKCEGNRDKYIDLLNRAILAFDNENYTKEELKPIFSLWVEEWSVEFKRCVKYLTDESIDFMKKYLSEAEIKVVEDNFRKSQV